MHTRAYRTERFLRYPAALFALALGFLPACATIDGAATGSDDEIRYEVHARLSDDLGLQRLLIGVQCVDGVVELSGRVPSAGDVARAISIARGTSGVRGVVDRTTR